MWTDERVDLLKQLWNEGLSASQIANKLGEVTRNAVIGKVHRLGLSGRGAPAHNQHSRPRLNKSRPAGGSGRVSHFPTMGSAALKAETESSPEASPAPKPQPLREVPRSSEDRVTILQLTDKTCRWPLGEPGKDSFHFCGSAPKSGLPYCDTHARMAYQPLQDRRRMKTRGAA